MHLLDISFFLFLPILTKCYSFVELNHDYSNDTPFWPTPGIDGGFRLSVFHADYLPDGGWYATNTFFTPEHAGTHVDAPYHFEHDGWTVDDIPLEHLISPNAVVIDIRDRAKENPNAELSPKDIIHWIEMHGPIPNNSIILVLTGWDKRYGDTVEYFGHLNDSTKFSFPGISVEAAEAIAGLRYANGNSIVGVGIDTASMDYGPSQSFPTHRIFGKANIYGLENLKNLERLPPVGAKLIVMPMKIRGGTGAPCRVVAFKPYPAFDLLISSGSSLSILNSLTILLFYSTIICFF